MRAAFLLFVFAVTAHAQQEAAPKAEILQQYNIYYSSIGVYIPLGEEQFPDGGQLEEVDVYRELFQRSLQPNVFALEASVYPMPLAGVWLRKDYPDLYDRAPSLIQAVTAGFQEPWAISTFFGSQMKFTRPGEGE